MNFYWPGVAIRITNPKSNIRNLVRLPVMQFKHQAKVGEIGLGSVQVLLSFQCYPRCQVIARTKAPIKVGRCVGMIISRHKVVEVNVMAKVYRER